MSNTTTTSSPRLAEVARKAGVSLMTASRALREPDKVAAETRQRVIDAVESLGYVPNLVAGSLRSARTRTVGIIIPTIVSSLFADTVNGLSQTLEGQGYAILMTQSGYDRKGQEQALSAILGRRPDALMLIGSPYSPAAGAMLRRAADNGTTVVETWELPRKPIGAVVGFDNSAAAAAVALHHAAQGRRHLAFIGSTDARATARWKGFVAGCRKAGLKPPKRIYVRSLITMDDAAAACADHSGPGGHKGIDGIFAANDVHAMGALSGLRSAGRRVPEDVAVVGLGDLEIARHVHPSLTTVRIDGLTMGRMAGEFIVRNVEAAPASRQRSKMVIDIGFELIRRQSG